MYKLRCFLLAASVLVLSACGSGDAQNGDLEVDSSEGSAAFDVEFDESQLPGDFPKELIPQEYSSAAYTQLGGIEGATFENADPVTVSIQSYTERLGEPTISTDAGDGDRLAQWHTAPWMVGVMGNESETIVSVTRAPETD